MEQHSPQIIGHDAEVWLNFLKRDIPNYRNKPHQPSDPRNWYKVYKKLKKDLEDEMSKGEEELKATLDAIKSEKEKKTSQFVSQAQVGNMRSARGPMVFNSGRWSQKSTKSLTLMEKIKKEARDARAVKVNSMPARQQIPRSTVRQAPQQFVEQARRQAASPPPPAQPIVRAPRMSRPPMHAPPRPRGPAVEENFDIMKDREARLQAMKSRTSADRPEQQQTDGTSSSARKDTRLEIEKPGGLSSRYLEDDIFDEDDEPLDHRTLLKPPPDRPRSASPGRMSPKPVLKRKAPPSLFMSPSKKPILKRSGVT